jgi:formylglycine-generating enzyme required for sulfatase activity
MQEPSVPPLRLFEFETTTIQVEEQVDEKKELPRRKKEIVISRHQSQARFFVEDLGNDVTLEMVVIPGGTFTMGAPETEERSGYSERPQHQVTVQPFFMGKYPVTQAQWQAVAALPGVVDGTFNPNPSDFKGADRPVEQICWYEAVEFCARLSKHTGRPYRLPAEAEWEYACRAGTTTPFHTGETITTELANYQGTDTFNDFHWIPLKGSYGEGPKGEDRQRTTPVGSFPANAFGLYDMHGNVSEWCADTWHSMQLPEGYEWYTSNYEGAPTDGSAWESDKDTRYNYRWLRGGSWKNTPGGCRSASRSFTGAVSSNHNHVGFRVACAAAWIL